MLRATSISSATKLTVKLCMDANLDFAVVPSVEATIDLGTTTATSGCVVIQVGIPVFQVFGGSTVYLAVKTDAGTVTLAQSCIVWSE